MKCVVLMRLGERVQGIVDSDNSLYEFDDYETALKFCEGNFVCQKNLYQIVELDEL